MEANSLVPLYDSSSDYTVQSDQSFDASTSFIMRLKAGWDGGRGERSSKPHRA